MFELSGVFKKALDYLICRLIEFMITIIYNGFASHLELDT